MAAFLTWLGIVAYGAMGVAALYPSQEMMTTMAPVLMWAVAVLNVVLGLLVVFSPRTFRDILRSFLTPTAVRVIGLTSMLFGAALFRVGQATALPLLCQVVGAAGFVQGGVQLLIPGTALIIIEWILDWPTNGFRILGIGSLIVAVAFLYAAGYLQMSMQHKGRPEGIMEEDEAQTGPVSATPATPAPTPSAATPATPAPEPASS